MPCSGENAPKTAVVNRSTGLILQRVTASCLRFADPHLKRLTKKLTSFLFYYAVLLKILKEMAAKARWFQASDERCDSENSQDVTSTFAVVFGSGIKRCQIQTGSARFVSDYCESHSGGNNLTVVTNVGCGVWHRQ